MNIRFNIVDTARELYARRCEPENMRTLADIYWRSAIALACVCAIAIFVWSVWHVFSTLSELSSVPESGRIPSPRVSRSDIDDLSQYFAERAAAHQSLETRAGGSIADPSR